MRIGIEFHFSYYGTRGVVDVVLRKIDNSSKIVHYYICEIKSHNFSVGDALRQVNRAKQYFFKDKDVQEQLLSNFKEYRLEKYFPLILHANDSNLKTYIKHLYSLNSVDVWFFHENPSVEEKVAKIANMALFEQLKKDIRETDFSFLLNQ